MRYTVNNLSTGDISLAASLFTVGVPPRALRPLQVAKSERGDFVRVHFEATTSMGKRKTADLMELWKSGPEAIRKAPADPFSALMAWSKTRNAIFAAQRGAELLLGLCGPLRVLVQGRDSAAWCNGMAEPLGPARGFVADGAGLGAALVVLGVIPSGYIASGDRVHLVFPADAISSDPHAAEMARVWPEPVGNLDHVAAYFASAELSRRNLIHDIRATAPDLHIERGPSFATINQQRLEEGHEQEKEILKRIQA